MPYIRAAKIKLLLYLAICCCIGSGTVMAQSVCGTNIAAPPASDAASKAAGYMQALQLELQNNKTIRDVAIALNAQNQFSQQVLSYLQLVRYTPKTPDEQVAFELVYNGLSAGVVAEELDNMILQYWSATLPTQVAMYAELDPHDKVTLPTYSYWRLPMYNERVLRVSVIPTNGGGQVVIPDKIAGDLAGLVGVNIRGDGSPKSKLKLLAYEAAVQSIARKMFAQLFQTAFSLVPKSNSDQATQIRNWWTSTSPTGFYQIKADTFRFPGREIGFVNVICLMKTPPAFIKTRIAAGRILFSGLQSGRTRLLVAPQPEFAGLLFDANRHESLPMEIRVEDTRQADTPQPAPFRVDLPISGQVAAHPDRKLPPTPVPPSPQPSPLPTPAPVRPPMQYQLCDNGRGSYNTKEQTCDLAD